MTPKPAVWKHAKMRLRQRMNDMGGLDEMDEWRAAGVCAYLSSPRHVISLLHFSSLQLRRGLLRDFASVDACFGNIIPRFLHLSG
jgi:hypothetical protein